MLRHSGTEPCTLRRIVCVVWRKMVKCHVNMLPQDVCLYKGASLMWLWGSIRRCSCSYPYGCACDCWYRRELHIPHAIPFNRPKVFSLSVQQLFDRYSLRSVIVRGVLRLYRRVPQYGDFIFLAWFNWFWYVRVMLLSTFPCCLSTYIIKM